MAALNTAALTDTPPLPVSDTLFFKLQGAQEAVAAAAETVARVARAHGASNFAFAATDADADALWQNRKYALMATFAAEPGMRAWTTDVWYVGVSRTYLRWES
jgi:D-lactate dehydrogenase (cytochrome)